MSLTAAHVREQGVEFTVVLVTQNAAQPAHRRQTLAEFRAFFPGRVVVLCSQDSRGVPSYFGRADIVEFLSGLLIDQLPWKEYRAA
jgi:hypothetical protein